MTAAGDESQPISSPEEKYPRRVIVKFNDRAAGLPYEDNAEKYLEGELLEGWQKLAHAFPGIHLNRLYISVAPSKIQELTRRAIKLDPTYEPVEFLTYYAIDVPQGVNPSALVEGLQGWEKGIVEYAYVESIPAPLPAPPTGKNLDLDFRHYLKPPQVGVPGTHHIGGIDAWYAWNQTQSGVGIGAGQGVTFIDIERGWNLNHQDLSGAGIALISGVSRDEQRHGTNVLGILAAQDNGVGGVGIAYQATGKVISSWRNFTDALPNWHDAVMTAADALTFGDVLLLEAQIQPAGDLLPVELDSALFAVIRLATALGIVVVEAAGNGSTLLDNQRDSIGRQILNPESHEFRDSGAILVGAANPIGNQATRWVTSNFGARVNCFAWGSNVATTDTDANGANNTTHDRVDFSATSAASAIVAGAAVVLQGIAQQRLGRRLGAFQMRRILSDRTPGINTPAADRIGVMPNLRKIIDTVLNLTPDVVVRDYVGDTGAPHNNPVASPDVIVRPANTVSNPQASFGGSATMGNANLSEPVTTGNYDIFVRVFNRRAASANNVRATVYWSRPATLGTPNMWTRIGTSSPANVPASTASMTVLPKIAWPSNKIPAPGAYYFIITVGCLDDPDPIPEYTALTLGIPDGLALNRLNHLIRSNNNITWRDFNVQPPHP